MNVALSLLHLSLIDGIGPAVVAQFIARKSDSWQWEDLSQMTVSDLIKIIGFSEQKANALFQGLQNKKLLEQELLNIKQHKIKWITILDDDYPSFLKQIYLPPPVLYWQGTPLNVEEKCLAMVGSRAMNWYGSMAIERLIPPLVQQGWTIVSGGAIGVDSKVHSTTVDAGGKTVVVLGSGLLKPYPPCNHRLFDAIINSGGTLITPFSLRTSAWPGNFPARNRIIAGLSRGCVVVQAAQKSGASITANFALEQGRDLFAVPGSIEDELSVGCHSLIKQGAKLVQCAEDILEEYEIGGLWQGKGAIFQKNGEKQENGVQRKSPTQDDPLMAQILTCCANPTTLDELIEKTGLTAEALHNRLFDLQLQGIIHQQMGLWKRC